MNSTRTGLVRKLPFFKIQTLEKIATGDLHSAGLLPGEPGPINVELLVERLFGLEPVYRDLGPGILGCIRFSASKPEEIAIHEALTDLNGGPTLEHRFRSTLAHEIGHGRLHAGFYAELMRNQATGCAPELVGTPETPRPSIACRASDIRDGESTQQPGLADWERILEWQANRYMGALLAPARLVSLAVRDALEQRDPHTILRLSERQRTALAPSISQLLNVSRQLATIRLSELFPDPEPQGDLFSASLTDMTDVSVKTGR